MRRPHLSLKLVGAGRPVLLLHGLGGDRTQALGLLPETFRCTRVAPEMPGHGHTDLLDDEPVSFDAFASATAEVVDAEQASGRIDSGPMPIVGVSMGAGLASRLAVSRPDLVSRLVLVRPSFLDVSPPPNMAAFVEVARLLRDHGPAEGRRLFLTTETYEQMLNTAPAMAASLLGQFNRIEAQARARVIDQMPFSLPLPTAADYARIAVPTLVLAAPDDPVHAREIGRTLAGWIPGARFGTLPRKDLDVTVHQVALQHAVSADLGDWDASEDRVGQCEPLPT